MTDLINRQEAIERLTDIRICLDDESQQFMDLLIREISDLPSAERKKGKWISLDDFRGKYNENGYKCSECGEHSDYEDNFCPNCGADMRKRGE